MIVSRSLQHWTRWGGGPPYHMVLHLLFLPEGVIRTEYRLMPVLLSSNSVQLRHASSPSPPPYGASSPLLTRGCHQNRIQAHAYLAVKQQRAVETRE